MSSDYIPRLRRELLRAGAQQPARWRPARVARGVRPIVAGAFVALLALALATVVLSGSRPGPAEHTSGATHLTYRVEPATSGSSQRTAEVLRARLSAAGIDDAQVSSPSAASLTITGPAGTQDRVAQLVRPGRLAIYDWEKSLVGADASTAPSGDPSAQGVTEDEAKARASTAGRDARVVRDARTDAWFALEGEPALTHADVASARAAVDPSSLEPVVDLGFTTRGETAFTTLTRELARRGSAQERGGVGRIEAYQHFAVVLDDRILATPFVDSRESPDGLDGAAGAYIQGELTEQAARDLAATLSTGPLPAALTDLKVASSE